MQSMNHVHSTMLTCSMFAFKHIRQDKTKNLSLLKSPKSAKARAAQAGGRARAASSLRRHKHSRERHTKEGVILLLSPNRVSHCEAVTAEAGRRKRRTQL